MLSFVGRVGFFFLPWLTGTTADFAHAGAADEDDDGVQGSVALLQANISRLRISSEQIVLSQPPESVYHLHIPKIAGTSFRGDAEPIVFESGRTFTSEEGCFHGSDGRDHIISNFRHPETHVVSMFRYCLSNDGRGNRRMWEAEGDRTMVWDQFLLDPELLMVAFEDWLRAWGDMLDAGTLNASDAGTLYARGVSQIPVGSYPSDFLASCYNPVNLQTHRLQCEGNPFLGITYPDQLSVDLSIENMRSLWSIGLQEEYETSLCLLSARATGQLPIGCACDSRDQLEVTERNVNDAGTSTVTDELKDGQLLVADIAVTDELRELIDHITAKDQELYEAAVARFHADVEAVEAEYGVSILCDGGDDDDGDGI